MTGPDPEPALEGGQDGNEGPEDFWIHVGRVRKALIGFDATPWSLEPAPAVRLGEWLVSFFDHGACLTPLEETAGADRLWAYKGC